MEFYIVEGESRHGPYDLVAMIRKIRNGNLSSDTLVANSQDAPPVAAEQIKDLAEFFSPDEEESVGPPTENILRDFQFGQAIQLGWHFFQNNQMTTVYAGLYVLISVAISTGIIMVLPKILSVPAYFLSFLCAHFLFTVFLLTILRLNRGQPIELSYIKMKMGNNIKSLFIASSLIALLSMVGFIFIIIPGLFVLTVYVFTPWLITDHDLDFWEAMETSRKTIMGSDWDTIGVVFALVTMNFIAAMLLVFPLVFTLPITYSALMEMYEELYNY